VARPARAVMRWRAQREREAVARPVRAVMRWRARCVRGKDGIAGRRVRRGVGKDESLQAVVQEPGRVRAPTTLVHGIPARRRGDGMARRFESRLPVCGCLRVLAVRFWTRQPIGLLAAERERPGGRVWVTCLTCWRASARAAVCQVWHARGRPARSVCPAYLAVRSAGATGSREWRAGTACRSVPSLVGGRMGETEKPGPARRRARRLVRRSDAETVQLSSPASGSL
jgi:hypothetical protein